MFENIIGQQQTVQMLSDEFRSGTLPGSLLFAGPEYSGKLTTALELARALTCESASADWNCRCSSCRQQRLLVHPNTLLLGGRYFRREVIACGESLRGSRKEAAQYLYVRAVRKLLRRFDDALWEGEEQKLSRVAAHLESLSDLILSIEPGRELPSESRLEKLLAEAIGQVEKLVAFLGNNNIPVGVVRRARYWARITAAGKRKVFILENAEGMFESSRNALLKILEEPPPDVTFILLTTNRAAIIPTILSRTRQFAFPDRGETETQAVVERIFRLPIGDIRTLRDFFLRMEYGSKVSVRVIAQVFLEQLTTRTSERGNGETLPVPDEKDSAPIFTPEGFRYFLYELSEQCSAHLRNLNPGDADSVGRPGSRAARSTMIGVLESWNRLMQSCRWRVEVLNMSPAHEFESLFMEMRAALRRAERGAA